MLSKIQSDHSPLGYGRFIKCLRKLYWFLGFGAPGPKPLWKSCYFNSTFLATLVSRLKSRSGCPHFSFKFPTISNYLIYFKNHCLWNSHNKLTMHKYYFVTYFLYFVWQYVRWKLKDKVDTLIHFCFSSRVRVYWKKLVKVTTFFILVYRLPLGLFSLP